MQVITRLNLGGPAQEAILLSGHRLDPDRYDVLLVHGHLAPGEESMADFAESEGARVRYLPSLRQPISPFHEGAAMAGLVRIARDFRPQLVHTHTAKAGFLGRLGAFVAVRPRPALVHTFHGHVLEGYFGTVKSGLYRGLERRLARASDCLIAVSRATVDDLVRLGVAPREKFRIIHLGIDLEPFARQPQARGLDLRSEVGVASDELLLTYVGRLVPIKRIDVLLRGMARAKREGAALKLAIVGDGELRPELKHLASELGITPDVSFLGYRRDLTRIAAATDVAVISSDNEGTPVSLIEAAAAARPAVATDVGGVAEVVTPATGILVPPASDEAIARAFLRLAADAGLRREMGRRAREHVLGRFAVDRLLGDIESLYGELLASSAGDGPSERGGRTGPGPESPSPE
jgi:glycosyltransferase involved in cell wall biosynthesis